MSVLKRVLRREEGVTALEFAMVAPILFMLILGIIDYGTMMATQSALESAVTKTSRHYKALSRSTGTSDNVDQIRAQIWKTLDSGLIKSAKDRGNLRIYANRLGSGNSAWGNANSVSGAGSGSAGNDNYQTYAEQISKTGGCANTSSGIKRSCSFFTGDVVQYQVYYDYHYSSPFLRVLAKKRELNASMVVQNEPDM